MTPASPPSSGQSSVPPGLRAQSTPAAPLSRVGQVTGPAPLEGPSSDGPGPTALGRVGQTPELSEIVAAAVLAVPGVADLHGGTFGQVASYLPGRSVTGVRIRPDVTDIHVVLFWGAPVLPTAEQVRRVVLPLIEGLSVRVDVTIEDVIDLDPGATNAPDLAPQPPTV